MRRIAVIIVLVTILADWTTARGQDESGCPPNSNAPGCPPGVTVPDLPANVNGPTIGSFTQSLYSSVGLCYQPFLYTSPLQTTYVQTDIVAFRRDWLASQPFATLNNSTNEVLGTHDLVFSYVPGTRVLLGRRLNDWYAVEASFVGLLQWDEIRTVHDTTPNSQGTVGNLFSPLTHFGNPAQVGLDYNTFASIRTVSDFNNAEFNLRQRLDTPPSLMQASALCGFRFMNVHERFEYRTRSLAPTPVGADNAVDVSTHNNLFGVQVGGKLEFRIAPRCWINFEGKAILLRNQASQDTQYTVGPIGGPSTTVSGDHHQPVMTFAGDASTTALWNFTPSIVGRLGYQCIFIDGLALSSDNFVRNIPVMTTAPNELARNGHIAYHGPFAGVTVTW